MSASNPTQQEWAAALLAKLGIPQSPGAVQAIVGWENAEGGHWHNDAHYNPLNTTQPMPGAGNTGTQGNIKQYTSWSQGIDATAKTLQNGKYNGILSALRAGNANATADAIGASPWGTAASLVRRTIGATPKGTGNVRAQLPPGKSTPALTTGAKIAGSDLFSDKASGLKYATVWVALMAAGAVVALAGINRAAGGAPARVARRSASAGKTAAKVAAAA